MPPFAELPKSLKAAFNRFFDYAGFASPALTNPVEVVSNYARYGESRHGPMLNSLVQRAAHTRTDTGAITSDLYVLNQEANKIPLVIQWPVSALFVTDPLLNPTERVQGQINIRTVGNFLETQGKIVIASVEAPATTVASARYIVHELAKPGRKTYVEVPVGEQMDAVLDEIAKYRAEQVFAKWRTGGPNPPTFEQTADFMIKAAQRGLGYKLTGRLHGLVAHTNEDDGVEESGYLNVVFAATLARKLVNEEWDSMDEVWRTPKPGNISESAILAVLQEKDINAFEITDQGIKYGEHFISSKEIAATRELSLHSIGSCSFEEPVQELAKLRSSA